MTYDEFVELHGERVWDFLVRPKLGSDQTEVVRNNANAIAHYDVALPALRKMVADKVLPEWPNGSIRRARIMWQNVNDTGIRHEAKWWEVLVEYGLLPQAYLEQSTTVTLALTDTAQQEIDRILIES